MIIHKKITHLLIVLQSITGTAAQILEPPQNQTVPVNSVARYACRTTGVVVWEINNTQLLSDEVIQVFRYRSVQVDIEN